MIIKPYTHWFGLIVVLIGLLLPVHVFASILVVVHPDRDINNISPVQVANIFLGKTKRLSNGGLIIPVDQSRDSHTRNEFYSKLLNKNENQMNVYWARQVFTGRSQPPVQVTNCNEVRLLIKDNPTFIGYIHSDCNDIGIKVILRIP